MVEAVVVEVVVVEVVCGGGVVERVVVGVCGGGVEYVLCG